MRLSSRQVALVLLTAGIACGGGGSTTPLSNNNDSGNATPKEMVIAFLPVDLAASPFLAQASIDINNYPARDYPPIHIFGKTYQGHVEPTLNFDLLKIGTPVYAPFDGTILDVADQPTSCDTEMYLNPSTGDVLNHLSYDHVLPLAKYRVKGTTFKAGDQIATIGAWECTGRFGRVEMMVVNSTTANGTVTRARCPLALLDPTKKSALLALINSVMDWWNTLGSASAYSPSERASGVCPVEFIAL